MCTGSGAPGGAVIITAGIAVAAFALVVGIVWNFQGA